MAAAALRAEGVTLEAARLAVAPTLVGEEMPPNGGITAYARRVFHEALRAAASEPGHVIGVSDLLRAALRDERGGAARTLAALSAEPGAVLARLGNG